MLTPVDCDKRPDSPSCSPWYIAGRLGRRDHSGQWILREIRKLIDHAGFPPPILQLDAKGKPIAGLRLSSRWQREPVDAWFDAQPSARLSHALADAAHEAEKARAARIMDARADAIAAGTPLFPARRGRRQRADA